MSEFDKGYNQGGAQPGNYEQQQGAWARQRDLQREQEAAASAARERDQKFHRDFLATTTNAQRSSAGVGGYPYSPAGPVMPGSFKQIVSKTAMVALVCTALVWFFLLDRPAGPDLIGVLAGGYFGGAALGAGLWALGWALHFVGIVLRVVLKYTMAGSLLLVLFYLLTGSLPF